MCCRGAAMFDEWGAEDVFAADESCLPDVTEDPGVFMSSADEDRSDDGSVAGDLWSLAVTALAGAAAYAGVRRLLDRGRRGAAESSAELTSARATRRTAPSPVEVRPAPAP